VPGAASVAALQAIVKRFSGSGDFHGGAGDVIWQILHLQPDQRAEERRLAEDRSTKRESVGRVEIDLIAGNDIDLNSRRTDLRRHAVEIGGSLEDHVECRDWRAEIWY